MSNNKNIEAIYELSPMQQGMLFHSIYQENSGNYFEQISVTLAGDLNVSIFKSSWKEILQRHSVLRTSFVYKKIDKMLQIVHENLELPFFFEDWSAEQKEDHVNRIKEFLKKDKKLGFNLNKAPLLRIYLIKVDFYKLEILIQMFT